MKDDVRLAFVGCGLCLHISFGPVLRFVDGLEVVAGVYPDEGNRRRAREDYGIERGYGTLEECLDHETIDAALIAAPVHRHRDLAVACAEHGVHVLLEKPMARTVQECDDIIAAHRAAGTVLMVAFMKRYNRSMLKVAELLASGSIGEVMGVRHNWDWGGWEHAPAPGWRATRATWGGQWQDHGSHTIDLARWWAGPVRSVIGTFDITEPEWEVENEYNVICTHESGARSVHLSTKNYHRQDEEHYLIFGDAGTIELRHRAGVWHYTTPYDVRLHRWGREQQSVAPEFSQNWLEEGRRYGQYKVELDHFVECITGGTAPRTDGQSGRDVIEVITASYLSALEGREVQLPLTAEPDLARVFREMRARVPGRLAQQR